MTINKHIVSIVFNRVEGDSRVIKTGQAALNAGYDATIVGVTSMRDVERKEIDGVKVVLLPNYSSTLKKMGLWQDGNKDLRLLIGGYLHYAIPEIIALKPDLLHSHDMIGLKIGGVVHKAMLAGGRIVPWIHDLHEFVAGLKGDLAESYMPACLGWEREFLNVADHLVTVSDALAAEIQERYNVPYLPTVIYNTPKAGSFTNSGADIRSKIGLAKEVPLIVFVGGANRLRGCETILEAVARLDGVHLVFVSEGKYVSELTEKAPKFGIGERFHVHPYVPSDQVATFIRTADIGIHGLVHYPNAEVAMPNKMFEYLHAGLPIAVSDVHSMKVFVEMHGIGLPFVAEDAVSCSDTIRMLLDNQSSFRRRITVDLKRQYSWENQEEKIHLIYNRLIEAKHITLTDEKRERAAVWEKMEVVMFESIYARALTEAVCKAKNLAAPKQALTRLEKALIAQAVAFRKSGELNSAEVLLQQVMNQNPEDIGVYTQLAEVATARKDWDEAVKRWERVLSISQSAGMPLPKQALTRLEKARIAQRGLLGKLSYSIQYSKNLKVLTQLAEAATARKDWDEAVKRWEQVLSVSQSAGMPLPKQTLNQLKKASMAQAVAFRKSGELNSAEALLQQVMNQNPEDIGVYTQLAEAATARKDWDEAVKRWERVLSVSQSAGVTLPKQALTRLEKARIAQAVAFRKSGELNSAEALLQQVMNQNPEDIGVYTQLAEVATARKDWDEAIKRWERVLSISQSAGVPLPKQALTRLEKARMAQRGLLGKISYSIHEFFSFGRKK